MAPEFSAGLDNLGMLSKDSRCFSFDHRANGYARGEGFGVLVIKPLHDAIKDGDTIRAVIRSSASNQDGKTPSLTMPGKEAQERLIRDTYKKAALDLRSTRYFEAHGTGKHYISKWFLILSCIKELLLVTLLRLELLGQSSAAIDLQKSHFMCKNQHVSNILHMHYYTNKSLGALLSQMLVI
jgi:hypothetical protein